MMRQESGILENDTAHSYRSPGGQPEQAAESRIHAASAGQTTVLAYHELSPDSVDIFMESAAGILRDTFALRWSFSGSAGRIW